MTSWDQLEAEALDLVPAAAAGGVTLRVVGSAGIRLHCAGPAGLMDALGLPRTSTSWCRRGTARACAGSSRPAAT